MHLGWHDLIFEGAVLTGAVPLLGVAAVARRSFVDPAYWWIAGAFAVSFVADMAAHVVSPWIVGATYPLAQSALVAATVTPRKDARLFLIVLVVVGLLALAVEGVTGPEVLLRSVAWLGLCWMLWPLRALGALRWSLLSYFGLGWVYWMAYVRYPGWTTYGLYQSSRLLGVGLFCVAVATAQRPRLTLIRPSQAA